MALLLPIESYAVNGAKPIYEAEYQYPALADGWYRIHDTLRAEMALFSSLFRSFANASRSARIRSRRGRRMRSKRTGKVTQTWFTPTTPMRKTSISPC